MYIEFFYKKNKLFLKKLLTTHPLGGIIKTRNEGNLKKINKNDKIWEDKTMKRFQVENCVQNARQYAGEEPYEHISYNIVDGDVEAENEKEAIVNALYYLADNINDTNGMYAEVNLKDESILIYNDDDEVVEYYFDFVAKEIED